MKIVLLTRSHTTIYSLVLVISSLLVGCIRQTSEVVSQSNTKSDNPLLESKNSSSFNYFQWKKQSSQNEAVARVKISEPSAVNHASNAVSSESPGRVTLISESDISESEENRIDFPESFDKPVEEKVKSWRSKSLIQSAKSYPTRISESYYAKSNRVKNASNSLSQGISSRIQRISKTVASPLSRSESENQTASSKATPTDQFRSREVSHYFDHVNFEKARSDVSKLEEDLRDDRNPPEPNYNGLNSELRRLQVTTIMDRAQREFAKKNYEYAAFLAEQALESSYRGHIAFGPEEESPQKLLLRIKKEISSEQASNLQTVEHTKPQVQNNSGQAVQNFQFSPSTVHPLKRRSPVNQIKPGTQSRNSTSSNKELPLIVPRNMGTDQQKITIRSKTPTAKKKVNQRHGISLDVPSFEQKFEEEPKKSDVDKPVSKGEISVQQPEMKLEEIPVDPPAKIRLSNPEPDVQQNSKKTVEKSTSPGPQLMLPKLPSGSQDFTSETKQEQTTHQTSILNHSGQNNGTKSAPVKYQSKVHSKNLQDTQLLDNENNPVRKNNKPVQTASGLTLDEIEWELDEQPQPQLNVGWSGVSALLLIIGGAIILLLLTIIFILLRRGKSSADAPVSE